ncbi:hypothetical protein B0T24DRAFT_226507 [Lasiosphaeria ovina]|uniref:Uncharacterized protein n=1 Tax=Lasiosphaeria ovina TaxID=92902 RepID=A0AAE0NAE0_9PEZI|nr:hypothetical protein B0T24DRAFT_226507 [Lasiosphaeria ovina]
MPARTRIRKRRLTRQLWNCNCLLPSLGLAKLTLAWHCRRDQNQLAKPKASASLCKMTIPPPCIQRSQAKPSRRRLENQTRCHQRQP